MRKFQKSVGRIQPSTIRLPTSKGFFQPLNAALQNNPRRIDIKPTSGIARTLEYWLILINDISQRPIIVHELVPGDPQYVVFTDASSLGKRVVRSIGTHQFSPIFLAVFLPEEVRNLLVSDKNVQGDIINSDLELTGIIL